MCARMHVWARGLGHFAGSAVGRLSRGPTSFGAAGWGGEDRVLPGRRAGERARRSGKCAVAPDELGGWNFTAGWKQGSGASGTGAFSAAPQSPTLRGGPRDDGQGGVRNGQPRWPGGGQSPGVELGVGSGDFVCPRPLLGSSLHFSRARFWGWRESRLEGRAELLVARTGVGRGCQGPTAPRKRGGPRARVQVQPLAWVGSGSASPRQLRTGPPGSALRESSGPSGSGPADLEQVTARCHQVFVPVFLRCLHCCYSM